MSVSSLAIIKERIMASNAPMAIFNAKRVGCTERGKLDVVFSDTVECRQLIKERSPYFICLLHSKMKGEVIDNQLMDAVERCKYSQ